MINYLGCLLGTLATRTLAEASSGETYWLGTYYPDDSE